MTTTTWQLATLLPTVRGHHESASALCPAIPKRIHPARTVGGAGGAGAVGWHRRAEVFRPTGPFRSESGQGTNRRLEQSPGHLPPGGRPLPVDRTGFAGAGHGPRRRTALDRPVSAEKTSPRPLGPQLQLSLSR